MVIKLTLATLLHLVGQSLAAMAQIVMPTIGPAFHVSDPMLHFYMSLLACGQAIAGIWAIFLNPGGNDVSQGNAVEQKQASTVSQEVKKETV